MLNELKILDSMLCVSNFNIKRNKKFIIIVILLSVIYSVKCLGMDDILREYNYVSSNSSTNDTKETAALNATKHHWTCKCLYDLVYHSCQCQGSGLTRVPQNMPVPLRELTIAFAAIEVLRSNGLKLYATTLRDITLTNLHKFQKVEPDAFKNITHLRTIYISHAPKLQYINQDTFAGISKSFKTLRIIHCGLLKIPNMNKISTGILLQLDLEGNQIREIDIRQFSIKAEQLNLDNNAINYIHKYAFAGSEIAKLSLKGNVKLTKIHEQAFANITSIQELDLSGTSIEALPTEGLRSLEILRIQNTHSLRQIPSVYNFKELREAYLTHPFHCCAFKFPSQHDPERHAQQQKEQDTCKEKGFLNTAESPILISGPTFSVSLYRKKRNTINKISLENINPTNQSPAYSNNNSIDKPITGLSTPTTSNEKENVELPNENGKNDDLDDFGEFHNNSATINTNNVLEALCGNLAKDLSKVKCYPEPDALNPCEDVMGSVWLRSSVWIVVLLAVFGNVAVLVVLFSNRSDLTVPKFLMCNLAFADFCMGLYLLLIAAIDIHSMGEYFNFAFVWQYGSGCKTAGLLTVFASHLSIFTLTIITIERWFAITHAIYLNKRIKLKQSYYIMIAGWIYSLVMASLPLFGISNYSSTSICLPMEARDSYDISYLIVVLVLNGFAFVIILICYALIYFSLGKETRIAGRTARTSGEMTVAKKMALLVFTNFACWAPIAFFGLTALAGYPLIDVTNSKILLVFFYPLNSCANPYLYAILTSQYRRDFFLLLAKCGFCKSRAQQYKMTYSVPTNTVPLHSVGKHSNHINNNNGNNHEHNNRASSLTTGILLFSTNNTDEAPNEHQDLV